MKRMNVMRFDGNGWSEVAAMDLVESDLVYYQGSLIEVTGQPTVMNEKIHLSARPYKLNDEPIVLAVGDTWRNRNATAMVMDFTNADCRDFGGGTCMIARLEKGPGAIYSPRLPEYELEVWCSHNLNRFEEFFNANADAFERGEVIKMEPWWAT